MGKSRDISKVLNNEGLVDANDLATGAAAANLGSYVSQVNGQSGSVTVEIPPSFASGTSLLFVQTAAPTGWTKSTAHDNKALRVVSGTAGSGGSVAFTTAFASQTPAGTVSVSVGAGTLGVGIGTLAVGSTTLSTAQMPSHNHNSGSAGWPKSSDGTGQWVSGSGGFLNGSTTLTTTSAGGGGSHNHGLTGSPTISGSPSVTSASFTGSAINLAVAYVDTIIATKD